MQVTLDEINSMIIKAQRASESLNKTFNLQTYIICFNKVISILNSLVPYEKYGIFDYCLPSKNLEEILHIRERSEKALVDRFISHYGINALNTSVQFFDYFTVNTQNYIKSKSNTLKYVKAQYFDKPFIETENLIVSLQEIRTYWKMHPQNNTYKNELCSITDYEYYGQVLMLNLYTRCSVLRENDGYCNYFFSECHLSNPKQLALNLIKKEFIGSASIRDILYLKRVIDLKEIAESIGCSKAGKKVDLISKIVENLSNENIRDCLSSENDYFIITEKGKEFLQKNYDYVELHRHWKYNISLAEYNKMRSVEINSYNFNDIAIKILKERIFNNLQKKYYLTVANDFQSLYQLFLEKNECKNALYCYLIFLYLSSACVYNAHRYNNDFCDQPNLTPDSPFINIYSTDMAVKIVALKDYYQPEMIDSICSNFSLPPSLLSIKELKESICDIINETFFDFDKYNNIIKKRILEYSFTTF